MPNYKIGEATVSVKGADDPVSVRERESTTYFKNSKPYLTFDQKLPHSMFNKERGDWILENKFEYGYNTLGGRRLGSIEGKTFNQSQKNQLNEIRADVPQNYVQNVLNKAHDNKQNWSIYPRHEHPNSRTKNVGDHAKSPLRNDIDQAFLRSTNLPFLKNGKDEFLTKNQGRSHGPTDKPELKQGNKIGDF